MTRQQTDKSSQRIARPVVKRRTYPFSAIVGQEELKLGLVLNIVAPSIGGVLIMGHRGTGKSTAVRALAELLPPLTKVRNCFYGCDPLDEANFCVDCTARLADTGKLTKERAPVPVVELPLNATEDRLCGTINLERALTQGVKTFEPGLLARAHRGFLYIDEVNLLEDHIVDLLLDVAATGRNRVEREGISVEHPARFVLAGSGNPEEGELRPQLLDRFGLYTEIRTVENLDERVEIIQRREAFDTDPETFCALWEQEQAQLRRRLIRARELFGSVRLPSEIIRAVAELCLRLKIDGHRGELTIARAARALAAFENRKEVTTKDVRRVAAMALSHRLRRDPMEQTGGGSQIEQAAEELFGAGANPDDASGTANVAGSPGSAKTPPDEPGGGDGAGARPTPDAPHMKEGRAADSRGQERPAPPLDARLPINSFDDLSRAKKPRAKIDGRAKLQSKAAASAPRGRYTRAVAHRDEHAKLALDATLRAAAAARMFRGRNVSAHALQVEASDFRYKRFSRRAGTLFIFAVDTSGSMALNRIAQAKGALARLLRQSYINRDRIALITFREREARVMLTPGRSTALAKQLLDALPIGGATPLTAGLLRALEISERAALKETPRIVLLVFTDGRANVPLKRMYETDRKQVREQIKLEVETIGVALQRSHVEAVVVDTQNRFTSGGEGQALADALGGRYVHLPSSR